jgi:hypothetical protein
MVLGTTRQWRQKNQIFSSAPVYLTTQICVKVLDMADLDGSDNVRVIFALTGGTNYAIAEDIVTYGITNSAN